MITRRILVPMDGSSSAAHALDCAIELAKSSNAQLALCVVVDPLTLTGHTTPHFSEQPIIDAAKSEADRLMREAVDKSVQSGIVAHGTVAFGDACEEILRHAKDTRADSIVMGTHGRTGFRRLFMGSVARGVLRDAACPVITVRERSDERAPTARPQRRPIKFESPIFMVRSVEVEPEHFERLYSDLAVFLREHYNELPGTLSSQVFGSDDGTRILIIVEFRSYEDWVRAQWDPRLARLIEEIAQTSETVDFELYRGEQFTVPAKRDMVHD